MGTITVRDAAEKLLVGGAFVAGLAFIALMTGGSVYRTDCTTTTGVHSTGWEMPMNALPYVSFDQDGCEVTTLTRWALGKAGVMSEVR